MRYSTIILQALLAAALAVPLAVPTAESFGGELDPHGADKRGYHGYDVEPAIDSRVNQHESLVEGDTKLQPGLAQDRILSPSSSRTLYQRIENVEVN
ncbi:hypothetical protein B7494_g3232 [Chlorociboria aeruginascens]|nr:hypothetical protein B7494_g3232 [Chlorociboria aeruginascens]